MGFRRAAVVIALAPALAFSACGAENTDKSGDTAQAAEKTWPDDKEVTQRFTEWRARKAARLSNNSVSISVDNTSCRVDKDGEAVCTETLTFDSEFNSLDKVESLAWKVEYRPDGFIVLAKPLD